MRPAAACLLVAFASAGAAAMAQAAGDPVDRPRAAAAPASATVADSWVFSETTSPLDYSPVAIATATGRGAPDGSGMKLSIACRGGNTSLVLATPGALPAGERYTVSYAVDGGPPTVVAAAAPSATGIALGADVPRLLVSLPARGEIVFRIVGGRGGTSEGRYSLAALKAARERMAVSCKWPAKPDTTRK
jgi:hypothetical protein